MNDNFLILKTKNNENVQIGKNSLSWAVRDRNINDIFDLGDYVFIKKNNSSWSLKQYPNVNGGIVALNPFTGEVKALVDPLTEEAYVVGNGTG